MLWEQELSGRENKTEMDVHTVCMLSEGANSKSSAQESVPDTSKMFMSCAFCCFSMMGVHSSQKHESWCFLAGFFSEEQRWQKHMEIQFHVSEYLSCFKSQKAFQPLPHTFKYKIYIVFHLWISWGLCQLNTNGAATLYVWGNTSSNRIILNFILYPSFHHRESGSNLIVILKELCGAYVTSGCGLLWSLHPWLNSVPREEGQIK